MFNLYFLDKCICFDSNASEHQNCEVLEVAPNETQFDMAKLLQKLQNTKKLVVISLDPERIFSQYLSNLQVIDAGGGVVENLKGEVLMIFRHDRWDLPKGKLEFGETIEECAIREVMEECGVTGLTIGDWITNTYHLYRLNGNMVVKASHWYDMKYDGDGSTTPQTEEGISRIEWVDKEKLKNYIKQTYPTIQDVFAAKKQ